MNISYHVTALYAISVGVVVAPGDFPSYLEAVKNLQLATPILFTAKALMAFPLVYHYCNGLRHLVRRYFLYLSLSLLVLRPLSARTGRTFSS